MCFDTFDQEPDYENGKGTIVSFKRLPNLSKAKAIISEVFGAKGKELIGEEMDMMIEQKMALVITGCGKIKGYSFKIE